MHEWNSRKKLDGQQWNILHDAVVVILKYKKSTVDHSIYIKVFYDGTVSYLKVSTDYFMNTHNNETEFPEITIVFQEHFVMKFQ